MSFSGNERNHLFLQGRSNFLDASDVSGLDDPADTRMFVLWDPDRDGWSDIALVNANTPRLALLRNGMSELTAPTGVIAVRLLGANHTSRPAPGASPRDACGALVTVSVGDRELVREHPCGTGLAAQNSATVLIGLGPAERAERVRVSWPSGGESLTEDVAAGTLLTLQEGREAVRSPYLRGG